MHNTLTSFAIGLIALLLLAVGCPSNSGGGSVNVNGNDNSPPPFEQSVELELTTNGVFDLVGGGPAEHGFSVSIRESLGMSALDALDIGLDARDVEIVSADTNGVGSNGLITLVMLVGALDDPGVCNSGLPIGRFEVAIGTNGEPGIDPNRLSANATALGIIEAGEFEMCLSAASDVDQTLTVSRLTFFLNATAPELDCSETFALEEVQDALDLLADEGFNFDLARGSEPRNITGTFVVDQTVEFDPDGSNEGALPRRTDTFSDQVEGRITRTTGRTELELFISGNPSSVSLCVLARTNNPDCDQTIARLESYDISSNGAELDGSFLAVVVERHPSDSADCGEAGDFIFGSITLIRQGTTAPADANLNDNLPDLDELLDELPPDALPGALMSRARVPHPDQSRAVPSPVRAEDGPARNVGNRLPAPSIGHNTNGNSARFPRAFEPAPVGG